MVLEWAIILHRRLFKRWCCEEASEVFSSWCCCAQRAVEPDKFSSHFPKRLLSLTDGRRTRFWD